MRFGYYNWASHPYNKTQGWVIGPFFRINCAISVPVHAPDRRRDYGFCIKFWRSRIASEAEIKAAMAADA